MQAFTRRKRFCFPGRDRVRFRDNVASADRWPRPTSSEQREKSPGCPRRLRRAGRGGRGKEHRRLSVDQRRYLSSQRLVDRRDFVDSWLDAARENRACHAAKVDSEVLDLRAVRNREVGGHADQDLVQRQAGWSKRDQRASFHAGEIVHLVRLGEAGENILWTIDRAEA